MQIGSTKLGLAVLELAADNARLRADLEKAKRTTKSSTDDMDKTTKKSTKSMSQSWTQLGSKIGLAVGGIALAATAIRGLNRLASESLAVSQKQIRSETELAAALKGHNKYTREGLELNIEYAKQMQRQLMIGDEVALNIQRQIAAVTGLSDVALNDATRAVIQFSNAYGVDLNAAAQLVGKTLVSNTNALIRYGVQIDVSGSKTDKLKNILEATASGWNIAAANAAQFEGRVEGLGNVTGDYKEMLGDVVTKSESWNRTLDNLSDTITNITDEKKIEALRMLADDIGRAAEGLSYISKIATDTEGGTDALLHLQTLIEGVGSLRGLAGIAGDMADLAQATDQLVLAGDRAGAVERISRTHMAQLLGLESPFADLEENLEAAREKAKELADNLDDAAAPAGELADFTGETAENLDKAQTEAQHLEETLAMVDDYHQQAKTAAREYYDMLREMSQETIEQLAKENEAREEQYISSAEKVGQMVIEALKAGDIEFVKFIQRNVDQTEYSIDEMVQMGAAASMDLADRWEYAYRVMSGESEAAALLAVQGFEQMDDAGTRAATNITQAFEKTTAEIKETAAAASRAFTASMQMSPERMEQMAERRIAGGDYAFAVQLLQGVANIREQRAEFESQKDMLRGYYAGGPNPFAPEADTPGATPGKPMYVRPVGGDSSIEAGAV